MRHSIKMRLGAVAALMAMSVLTACEKPLFPAEEGADQNGNLQVSVYQIEKTPFTRLTRTEQAASEVCTRLNFAVYDTEGSRVKQVNQTSDKSGFGTASFSLEEGEYQLVVVGHSSNGNPTMTNLEKIKFTNDIGYTDTFLYSETVTVGEESVEKHVCLDRIVSLCRFELTDDYPSGVKKMRFYYTGGSGAFNAETRLGSVASKQTVMVDVTSGQKRFDLYTFLHEQSDNIALMVTALDDSDNVLHEREFDVPMEQNHITWLSGAFFNGSGSSSASFNGVTVNTDWAGETHLTF